MPAGVNHWPDPGIQHGSFRVLPRTDGSFAVVDDRNPPGGQTIMVFTGKHGKRDAERAAKTWHAQGHG